MSEDDVFTGYSEEYGVDGLQVESFETKFNKSSHSKMDKLSTLDRRVNSFLEEHEVYDIQVDVELADKNRGFKSYTIVYREENADG